MKLRSYEQSKFPMNLQFFAEGEGDGAGGDQGGGSGDAETGEPAGAEGNQDTDPQTLDDILGQNKDFQAEFDRRVQKAIHTAKEKWTVLMDDKVSEAEKLAKMNKEEKAQYLQEKKEKEIQDREAAITKRELAAEAKNTLAEKGLPAELAEVLNYSDADSCKQSISAVEKAFQKAVEKTVEEKLKGGQPPKNPQDQGSDLQKEIEKAMMGL